MRYYGAKTQKPTMLLTNANALESLHDRKTKRSKAKRPLCRKYRNALGRPAYCGTKWLKSSQQLVYVLSELITKCVISIHHHEMYKYQLHIILSCIHFGAIQTPKAERLFNATLGLWVCSGNFQAQAIPTQICKGYCVTASQHAAFYEQQVPQGCSLLKNNMRWLVDARSQSN